MKSLFLIMVLLTAPVSAQDYTSLFGFTPLMYNGKYVYDNKYVYFVNIKDAKLSGESISFTAVAGEIIHVDEDSITADKNNHEFIIIAGNCKSFEFTPRRIYGKRHGESYSAEIPPKILTAQPKSIMYEAIKQVCTEKIGELLRIGKEGKFKD